MPKITGVKQDPAANHREFCPDIHSEGKADQDKQDVPKHQRDWAEKEAEHPGRRELMIK